MTSSSPRVPRRLRPLLRSAILVLAAATIGAALGMAARPPAAAAASRTFFVATSGSDANPGTGALPWRTLAKAAATAPAGATVQVRAGTYAGFTVTRSGASGAPITFQAYGSERATVRGGGRTFAIDLRGVHDVAIRGLVVTGAAAQWGAGIHVSAGARNVTIAGNTITGNATFGILIEDATAIRVTGNAVSRNATGIQVSRAGAGILIDRNRVFANDRMVVANGSADRGANGLVFYHTTGAIRVTNNRVYGNRAVSPQYGLDGGAFEVFASSNLTFTGNVAWDNQNVMETGTDGSARCANIVFTRNVAYKGGATSVAGPSEGLILRCAENSLIANNSFYGLDRFTFDLDASGGGFSGSLDGLTIANNASASTSHVYSIDSALPSSVSFENNLAFNPSGGAIAYVSGHGNTPSHAVFVRWTGQDVHGLVANPRFTDAPHGDLRPVAGSPLIDRGRALAGVTGSFLGRGPDIGRYELR